MIDSGPGKHSLMKMDSSLVKGSSGGHGPIRYHVSEKRVKEYLLLIPEACLVCTCYEKEAEIIECLVESQIL